MHIIENPTIPFTTPVVNGMNHDAKIEIHGTPTVGPNQHFSIELFAGANIALHLNARFGYTGDYQLVLNSMDCGQWGGESRHGNPFQIGKHFHLKIKAHRTHYKITVNDRHICDFPARVLPHTVSALGIKGDVAIQKIHFEHFRNHNGGGKAVGMGQSTVPVGYGVKPVSPGVVPVAAPVVNGPPPPYYAPQPQPQPYVPPPVVQQPVYQPQVYPQAYAQPYVQPVYMPQAAVMAPSPMIYMDDYHHHHHHGHGLLHNLFGHHHHHGHHGHHHHHC